MKEPRLKLYTISGWVLGALVAATCQQLVTDCSAWSLSLLPSPRGNCLCALQRPFLHKPLALVRYRSAAIQDAWLT